MERAQDINKVLAFGDRLEFHLSTVFGFWSEGNHWDWLEIRA